MAGLKYTEETLREAVRQSRTLVEVLAYLGSTARTGGMVTYIRARITLYNINTNHFIGSGWAKGMKRPELSRRRSVTSILVRSPGRRMPGHLLRRALIEIGVPYLCGCGQKPEWRNSPLVLEVDHIDGDWSNNLQENLRFICPNCHSQTPTFRSKNRRRVVPVGSEGLISLPARFDSEHADRKGRGNFRTKIQWPVMEELSVLVMSMPLEAVGQKLGVSGAAIKKRCARLGIQTPRGRGQWKRNQYTAAV